VHIKAPYSITDCRRFFAQPATARQRQYEALRAFFVEGLRSGDAARRFGYSPGAFRVLCHAFRRGQLPDFFATARTGPREQPKKSRAQEQIVALRKRNYSVYEISQALAQQGTPLSATAVREVLAQEGFAPLPRRRDDERPIRVGPHPEPVANVHDFILAPREFTTRVGGLFLFVPDLVRFDVNGLATGARLPGSGMIPAGHALRASLALKLWSIERKSHVMALVADEGLALFCGLNAVPKKSTILLTNDRSSTPSKIIARYARRMLIENALSDAVRFFHIDALSSSVGFKVDFDMALLVVASGLYRLMANRMRGYSDAQARQIFRDLVDMPADVAITEREITVRFHRRAHLPIVLASGLIDKPVAIPWWQGRALRLVK